MRNGQIKYRRKKTYKQLLFVSCFCQNQFLNYTLRYWGKHTEKKKNRNTKMMSIMSALLNGVPLKRSEPALQINPCFPGKNKLHSHWVTAFTEENCSFFLKAIHHVWLKCTFKMKWKEHWQMLSGDVADSEDEKERERCVSFQHFLCLPLVAPMKKSRQVNFLTISNGP